MKKPSNSTLPNDVEGYLALLPEDKRGSLEKIRRAIQAAAPKAEEVIRYRMPIYKYHGMLVGFAAFKNHCSLFVMSKAVMKEFAEKLAKYETSAGTIRFPIDKPLSALLVKQLVRARIKQNEARFEQKQKKSTKAPPLKKKP